MRTFIQRLLWELVLVVVEAGTVAALERMRDNERRVVDINPDDTRWN